MRYWIETYGCQMNESDSLLLGAMLEQRGYRKATNLDEADAIIVNTCCVRENAENKIRGFIGNLLHYKRQNKNCIIAVCGCMAQKEDSAHSLAEKAKHIDILVGTFALSLLPDYIEAIRNGSERRIIDIEERYDREDICLQKLDAAELSTDYKAQVSIIYGCNNFCSYCIVPYVRGRERSRDPQIVLDEIKLLVGKGCKEVQLLGQNVNSYGKTLEKQLGSWDFARLLEEVCQIEGLERVRYMTSHPRDFNPRLLETILAQPKIAKHFHLPVQSGCDRILQKMNRGYTSADYLKIVRSIREACPEAAITSDMIVGFPGETEADFAQTLDFLRECRLDAAYTFIYSRRSGTPAAKMENQVPEDIKRSRLQALMDVQNPISLYWNQRMVGKTYSVLVEGESKTNPLLYSGRTEQNKIVVFAKENSQIGQFVDVNITEAKTWNLCGELKELK